MKVLPTHFEAYLTNPSLHGWYELYSLKQSDAILCWSTASMLMSIPASETSSRRPTEDGITFSLCLLLLLPSKPTPEGAEMFTFLDDCCDATVTFMHHQPNLKSKTTVLLLFTKTTIPHTLRTLSNAPETSKDSHKHKSYFVADEQTVAMMDRNRFLKPVWWRELRCSW